MQNNWSKRKRLYKKSQFNSRKIGWNTLEFQYGRCEVMSKRSIQWRHLHIVFIYTSFIILYRCVRLSSNGARSHVIPRQDLELIFRGTFCLDPLAIGISLCNVQSGPLISTLSPVAYCMK